MVLIFLGNADHQAQVGRHHPISSSFAHADLVPLPGGELVLRHVLQLLHRLHVVRKLDFFGSSEQWNASNAAQVEAD